MTCPQCAVRASLSAFARALDRNDADAVAALFIDDAIYDNGRSRVTGRRDLYRWVATRAASSARTTRHVWSALEVTRADHDMAATTSTWVCYAANQAAPVDAVKVWSVADFEDIFHRVGDRWLVAERRIHTVFRDLSVAPPA